MIESPRSEALLAGPLGEWLGDQADLRTATREKAQRRFLLAIGAAAMLAFVIVVKGGPIVTALQLGFFVGVGGFVWSEWTKRPVIRRIKAGINEAIARSLGLAYSAAVDDRFHFERALRFGLLPAHDKAELEDQWTGEVGGRPFRLHEARLTEQRGSGKNRRTVTLFQGVVMAIGFARSFTGTTLIERDGRHDGLLGLLGREREEITVANLRLSRLDTVAPAFDDTFDAWTDDQVEGHYLINPAYVERLVAVESAFAARKLRALFREGELLLVFETDKLFESGSLEPGDDRRLIDQAIAQFGAMADLAMRLNERGR